MCTGVQTDELATADLTENPHPGLAESVNPPAKDNSTGSVPDSRQTISRLDLSQLDGPNDGYELPVHDDPNEHGIDTVLSAEQALDTSSVMEESGMEEEGSADADLDAMEYDFDSEGDEEQNGISPQPVFVKEEEQEELLGLEAVADVSDTNSITATDSDVPLAVSGA